MGASASTRPKLCSIEEAQAILGRTYAERLSCEFHGAVDAGAPSSDEMTTPSMTRDVFIEELRVKMLFDILDADRSSTIQASDLSAVLSELKEWFVDTESMVKSLEEYMSAIPVKAAQRMSFVSPPSSSSSSSITAAASEGCNELDFESFSEWAVVNLAPLLADWPWEMEKQPESKDEKVDGKDDEKTHRRSNANSTMLSPKDILAKSIEGALRQEMGEKEGKELKEGKEGEVGNQMENKHNDDNDKRNDNVPTASARTKVEEGEEEEEEEEERKKDKDRGLVGLRNLGNTCFMNASLQALSGTPPLRHYFASNTYGKELNATNPLGMEGKVALHYGALVKRMWPRTSARLRRQRRNMMKTKSRKRRTRDGALNSEGGGRGIGEEADDLTSTSSALPLLPSDKAVACGEDEDGDGDGSSMSSSHSSSSSSSSSSSVLFRYASRLNPLPVIGALAGVISNDASAHYHSDVVTPFSFKSTIARFSPMFDGYDQHDAQELLAFVLDGLHEGLNRVLEKPYVAIPDSNGRADAQVSREHWEAHLQRNRSVIVDLFTAQLKSTLKLSCCGFVSTKFDPYNMLSLPLPLSGLLTLTLRLVGDWRRVDDRKAGGDEEDTEERKGEGGLMGKDQRGRRICRRRCRRITLKVAHRDTVMSLCERLADELKTSPWKLMVARVFDNAIRYIYEMEVLLETLAEDGRGELVAFEVQPGTASNSNSVMLSKMSSSTSSSSGRERRSGATTADPLPVQIKARVGGKLDVLDTDKNWLAATVKSILPSGSFRVHFDGWPSKWDEWLSLDDEEDRRRVRPYLSMSPPRRPGRSTGTRTQREGGEEEEQVETSPAMLPRYHLPPGQIVLLGVHRAFQPTTSLRAESRPIISTTSPCLFGEPFFMTLPGNCSTLDLYALVCNRWIPSQKQQQQQQQQTDHPQTKKRRSRRKTDPISALVSCPCKANRLGIILDGKMKEDCHLNTLHRPPCKFAADGLDFSPFPFRISAVSKDGLSCKRCSWVRRCNGCVLPMSRRRPLRLSNFSTIAIDWVNLERSLDSSAPLLSSVISNHRVEMKEDAGGGDSSSTSSPSSSSSSSSRGGVSLEECFSRFVQPESLDGSSMAYCSKCKEHRPATKELQIWTTPSFLIIHLKRLLPTGKLRTYVDFPVTGLDMSRLTSCGGTGGGRAQKERKEACGQKSSSRSSSSGNSSSSSSSSSSSRERDSSSSSMLYDLYGVVNHVGNSYGGHYYAYVARRKADGTAGKDWFCFDDDRVEQIGEDEIKTNAAYMLFYHKRGSYTEKLKFLPERLTKALQLGPSDERLMKILDDLDAKALDDETIMNWCPTM